MSIIVNAFENGAVTSLGSTNEIAKTYEFTDGNHVINVEGGNKTVVTKDGNSRITTKGDNCSVTTGDGNQVISNLGSNYSLKTGEGNNLISHIGNNYSIETGNGKQTITALGDNGSIITDSGDDDVTFIGDGVNANLGDGNNNLIFWGNNCDIKTGSGNDSITTYDQLYEEGNEDAVSQAFLSKLDTGIWQDAKLKSRTLIDYHCKKNTFSKTRTYVYEDHYDVKTYFSRYINGVENTNIDMGGGTNTANVTLDKETSTIKGSGTNNITMNKDWQIDKLIAQEDVANVDTEVVKTSRKGMSALAVAGTIVAGVVLACTPLGAALGSVMGAIGNAIGGAVTSGLVTCGVSASAATAIVAGTSTALAVAGIGQGIYSVGKQATNIIENPDKDLGDFAALGTSAMTTTMAIESTFNKPISKAASKVWDVTCDAANTAWDATCDVVGDAWDATTEIFTPSTPATADFEVVGNAVASDAPIMSASARPIGDGYGNLIGISDGGTVTTTTTSAAADATDGIISASARPVVDSSYNVIGMTEGQTIVDVSDVIIEGAPLDISKYPITPSSSTILNSQGQIIGISTPVSADKLGYDASYYFD